MPPVGIEATISASERPQTHALDRAATATGQISDGKAANSRPEESYRLWCVAVYDLETSRLRRPWPALGHSAT